MLKTSSSKGDRLESAANINSSKSMVPELLPVEHKQTPPIVNLDTSQARTQPDRMRNNETASASNVLDVDFAECQFHLQHVLPSHCHVSAIQYDYA